MAVVCPTITAYDLHEYRQQMEQIEGFAERIHIDLMDGQFAPNVSPELEKIWWPPAKIIDLHLMFNSPQQHLAAINRLHPSLVIIHFEAHLDVAEFAEQLRAEGIKTGVALLQNTPVEAVEPFIKQIEHVMVYSGNLGEHGGSADLGLLQKVQALKALDQDIEISWDGGINDQNAKALVEAGVDVLNVGGFIQKSADPQKAYATLKSVIGG